jgi:hypothetical protein
MLRQQVRDPSPDPTSGTGDQRDFSFQNSHALSSHVDAR